MSKSKQPTCLGEISRKLEKKPEDYYGETHGGYQKNLAVTVEKLEVVRRSDEEMGVKWAWSRCACVHGCDRKAYIRFRSGNVKIGSGDERGDMEPGKTYAVKGSTMMDAYGNLIITTNL